MKDSLANEFWMDLLKRSSFAQLNALNVDSLQQVLNVIKDFVAFNKCQIEFNNRIISKDDTNAHTHAHAGTSLSNEIS